MFKMKKLIIPCLFFQVSFTYANIEWSGDLRYRHERFSHSNSGVKESEKRERVRARLKAKGEIAKTITATVRLATGGASVTSTNATLDGSGSNKDIHLDQAFVEGKSFNFLSYKLGKMGIPFYRPGKSDLMFDGDWTPEGAFAQAEYKSGIFEGFFNVSRIWIDNNSDDSDTILMAPQLGLHIGDKVKFSLGSSYYHYSSSSSLDNLGFPYTVMQVFSEINISLDTFKMSIFGDYAKNLDAPSHLGNSKRDLSYLVGAKFSIGMFFLKYDYRWVEENATPSGLDDGDSCNGSVGCSSQRATAGVKLTKKITLSSTYYAGVKRSGSDKNTQQNKFHLNTIFKF